MIYTYQKEQHLYLVIQDFEDKIEDIYKEIRKFPKNTPKLIQKILKKNFFSDSLQRQKQYVSSISTYIDGIYGGEKQYFFHLYILPKDLNIIYNEADTEEEKLIKYEQLSIKLFRLYSQLNLGTKKIEIFEQYKGDSFLQLEANFYIDKLDKLYSYLLNYKAHSKNKVICSDKFIGVAIDDLNRLESNPLKNYQFIKVNYQKELIHFIYSIMQYIKQYRIDVFASSCFFEYSTLIKKINRINNLLLKISSHKNMLDSKIKKDKLSKYLKQYKNKKEIKDNRNIFILIESIFYTQLSQNIQFFESMDLTKIFEKIVEKNLDNYHDRLYIGDESRKEIYALYSNLGENRLNNINFLLNGTPKKLKQYPDFLLKDETEEIDIYHIIDAKYKLKKNILNESDIRQLLTYAILFNKEFSNNLVNQKKIQKIIVYVEKTDINLDSIDMLKLNDIAINLSEPTHSYNDNIFDSKVNIIGLPTLINVND